MANAEEQQLDPERAQQIAEAVEARRAESIPGREEAAAAEAAPPAEPMTKGQALVYVQHLLVAYLEEQVVYFKEMAEDAAASELDRKDAALVAEVAVQVQKDLSLANTIIMAQDQRVQLAGGLVAVPGARPPRGGA